MSRRGDDCRILPPVALLAQGRGRTGSRQKCSNVGENDTYLVENGPRIRRPGSPGDRAGDWGNLERSGRSPDSTPEHIRRLGATLYGGAPGMQGVGEIWAIGPGTWRIGSEVNRGDSAWNFELGLRPADSAPGNIIGAMARLRMGASRRHEGRRERAALGANGPIIRRPGSWSTAHDLRGISRYPGGRRILLPNTCAVYGRGYTGAPQACSEVGGYAAHIGRMAQESCGHDQRSIA